MIIIKTLQRIVELLETIIDLLIQHQGTQKVPLRELAEVMARMEGFYRTDIVTLAQKNNNPLNLRPSGYYYKKNWIDKKNNFVKFPTLEKGWEGCCWDLCYKCSRSKSLGPEATIKDLVFRWSATDQEIYIKFVCDNLNINREFKLKMFDLDCPYADKTYC